MIQQNHYFFSETELLLQSLQRGGKESGKQLRILSYLVFSLSLSHTHTHTYTHTISLSIAKGSITQDVWLAKSTLKAKHTQKKGIERKW